MVASLSQQMSQDRVAYAATSGPRMAQTNSRFIPAPSYASTTSLDYMIRNQSDLQNMWARANQLMVDAPLVRTAVEQRMAMSRIMDWNPKPDTGNADLNVLMKTHWDSYANDPKKCDVYRKQTFAEMTASAMMLHAIHGDVVAPITESSAIKVCEAWRMRSPQRTVSGNRTDAAKYGHLGVCKDADGQALSYWLTKEPVDPLLTLRTDEVESYPALDENGNSIFLHPMAPGRPSTRGISLLAPVSDLLYMQMDLLFTKLVQEQVASCVMFSKEITVEGFQVLQEFCKSDPVKLAELFKQNREDWKPSAGGVHTGVPGEKVVSVTPNITPQNFIALNEFMILCLAVNLDCPALAITLDATKANFSQFRNVTHQSRMRFECLHQWWTPQWHKPVYEHVMRRVAQEAIQWRVKTPLHDAIRAFFKSGGTVEKFLCCTWTCPEYEYIEPVKDITAEALARAEGSDTDEEWATQKKGKSWDEFSTEFVGGRKLGILKALHAMAEVLADSIVTSNPAVLRAAEAIPWTVYLSIPLPKSFTPVPPAPPEPAAPAADTTPAGAAA